MQKALTFAVPCLNTIKSRAAFAQQNHDVEHTEVSISILRQLTAPAMVKCAGFHVQRCFGRPRAEDTTEQGRLSHPESSLKTEWFPYSSR